MAKPLLLGIEIGGTKLQVGLGHGDGSIRQSRRTAVDRAAGAGGIRAAIEEQADRACWAEGTTREAIEGVGIGFGGPVDSEGGIVATSHQIDGWDGFPLADWARSRFGTEMVAIRNDADTAAMGEARFGAGRGFDPLLFVTIGSGVGAGLVVGGRIFGDGPLGAMELGHLCLQAPGERERRTVEGEASGWSIERRAREALERNAPDANILRDLIDGDPSDLTAEVVAMAAGLGDAASTAILERAQAAIAAGLAHAATLLAPRRIILGGGVSNIGEDQWFNPIRGRLDRRVFPPYRGTFDLVPAALGEAVVVHGALAIARDAVRSSAEPPRR